jgi:hypothetical protein
MIMRKITTTALTLLLLIAPLFAANASAGEHFDFAKTREFIGEMEGRPDFPVSLILANDYACSLRALGEAIRPDREKSIVAYLQSIQQKDGSFAGDRIGRKGSALFTDIALGTLDCLDTSGSVKNDAAKKFILSLKNSDGGFGFSRASRESSLATTYYAVRILSSMSALSSVDKARTAQYIKKFERKNTGGFGSAQGPGVSTARDGYMAVYALYALDLLDDATRKNTVRFLETAAFGKQSFKKEMPELNEALFAIRTARLLNSEDSMDRARIMKLLNRLYIPVNGGFGPIEGYGSTPDSTATALRILAETGALKGDAPGSLGMR